MSALGQKQTFRSANPLSALPPIADIHGYSWNVRFVPIADIAPLIRSPRRPGRAVSRPLPSLLPALIQRQIDLACVNSFTVISQWLIFYSGRCRGGFPSTISSPDREVRQPILIARHSFAQKNRFFL